MPQISERILSVDFTAGTIKFLRFTEGSNVAQILTEKWNDIPHERFALMTGIKQQRVSDDLHNTE